MSALMTIDEFAKRELSRLAEFLLEEEGLERLARRKLPLSQGAWRLLLNADLVLEELDDDEASEA